MKIDMGIARKCIFGLEVSLWTYFPISWRSGSGSKLCEIRSGTGLWSFSLNIPDSHIQCPQNPPRQNSNVARVERTWKSTDMTVLMVVSWN